MCAPFCSLDSVGQEEARMWGKFWPVRLGVQSPPLLDPSGLLAKAKGEKCPGAGGQVGVSSPPLLESRMLWHCPVGSEPEGLEDGGT